MTREEAIDLVVHGEWIYSLQVGNKEMQNLIEAISIIDTALRPISREQVEKVWRGEWILELVGEYKHLKEYHCSECGYQLPLNPTKIPIFCENCGSPLTDEAVEIVMERLEALHETV